MPQRTRKIAIVGAGSVGATVAYACMIRGVAEQVVLYDTNRAKVDAEVLDLNLVLADISLTWSIIVPLAAGVVGLAYTVLRLNRQDVA